MRSVQLVLEGLEARAMLAARVTEWAIPGGSVSLEGITLGPDGNLWYTSFNNGKIGRVTPTGTVTEFEASGQPNGGPVGITAGPDGNLWYTLKNVGRIGRMTPSGVLTEYPASTAVVSGPEGITAGPDGNVWFTQRLSGRIGRISPDGVLAEFPITSSAVSQPVGITAGPDGNLWFVEYGANRIGRITPTGTITEYDVPTPNSGPFAIVTGPDGNLWFTERNANQIGRITWTGKRVDEFPLATPNAQPVGIAAGPDGNVWFTERNSSKISQITPSGIITAYAAPTVNGQPFALAFGSSRTLAFTQLGATGNRVAVVQDLVTAPQGFLQALYRRALNRFASPPELENWGAVLGKTNSWVVANAIERSPEARMKLVKKWYVTHLGRVPGAGEENHWVQLLLGGSPEEQVLSGILSSQEYFQRSAQLAGSRAATDDSFVRALFKQILGRNAGDAEVTNLRTNFLAKHGRHGLAWTVLNSEEYRTTIVQGYYRNLLGRTNAPATAEVRSWVYAQPWHDWTMLRVGFAASGEFFHKG